MSGASAFCSRCSVPPHEQSNGVEAPTNISANGTDEEQKEEDRTLHNIRLDGNPIIRVNDHLLQQVHPAKADIVLYFCWFNTGLLDGTVFNAYRIFLLMQTGNLIFLGLDTSHNTASQQPYAWVKSLTSFVGYIVGCTFFANLDKLTRSHGHPRRRLTLFISFSIQAVLIFLCAILLQTHVIGSEVQPAHEVYRWLDLVPVILLSLQGPGQILAARQLGYLEMPTVVASIMMYDFASDPDLLARRNVRRTRRFMGVVVLLAGAICGGWIVDKLGHITVALWVGGSIKGAIAVAWLLWPRHDI